MYLLKNNTDLALRQPTKMKNEHKSTTGILSRGI